MWVGCGEIAVGECNSNDVVDRWEMGAEGGGAGLLSSLRSAMGSAVSKQYWSERRSAMTVAALRRSWIASFVGGTDRGGCSGDGV